MQPDELIQLLESQTEDIVLFDVREEAEFGVSHLPGAAQMSPKLGRRGFKRQFASDFSGKTVVFYCSVGVRSSKMGSRLETTLRDMGANRVVNLSGGLFRWHNESREGLVDSNGSETEMIHPYDPHWGKLVARGQSYWSFEPPAETAN